MRAMGHRVGNMEGLREPSVVIESKAHVATARSVVGGPITESQSSQSLERYSFVYIGYRFTLVCLLLPCMRVRYEGCHRFQITISSTFERWIQKP